MAEPKPRHGIFGLLAEFDEPEKLVEATRRAREAGYGQAEAYSPFPIEGLTEAVGWRDRRIPLAALFGGIAGAAAGYGLQAYTNLDFPIIVGGRPLIAPPAFALITFEVMVLGAVTAAIGMLLSVIGLPRLHHPLFEVEEFHLASSERFFLVLQSHEPDFDVEAGRRFLGDLSPVRIETVPFAEVSP